MVPSYTQNRYTRSQLMVTIGYSEDSACRKLGEDGGVLERYTNNKTNIFDKINKVSLACVTS